MQNLLRECNVASVTVLADVFPDIDSDSKLPMLFRADALEGAVDNALGQMHLTSVPHTDARNVRS